MNYLNANDVFNRSNNMHITVTGRSGSGKTFFIQQLINNNLSCGGKTFIIDVGHSFEHLVKLFGGSYVEFTMNSQICVNPFTHVPIDSPDETLLALTMIIALMAAPLCGTNDLENALIEISIRNVWAKHSNQATIDDVAIELSLIDDQTARDLSASLYPYTKQGAYGNFFNGTCNVDLSASMVVLEMEELRERHDLQAVIVQIMILQVINAVYMGDQATRVQLVIDEAGSLLRGSKSELFVETAARRLRQYNGALIVSTQSANDFYSKIERSDWMALLLQKGSVLQLTAKKLYQNAY